MCTGSRFRIYCDSPEPSAYARQAGNIVTINDSHIDHKDNINNDAS